VADPQAFVVSALLAAGGYVAWRRAMQRSSLIAGTPTSRIATAAKGYVELAGVARAISAERLLDPATHRPCLWFHVVTERRRWNDPFKWRIVDQATSTRPLVLEDPSGSCAIDVRRADMEHVGPAEIVRVSWGMRHRVRRIVNGKRLYALGHLERLGDGDGPRAGDAAATLEVQSRTAAVLRDWKKNPTRLAARFDADGDGRIDAEEWERARTEAHDSVLATLRPRSQAAGGVLFSVGPGLDPIVADPSITHRLAPAPDGRPLLLSTKSEADLASSQRWSSLGGLALFVLFTLAVVGQLGRCTGS
jgi:hypothetical protein